jgi:hypothetical protein
VNKTVGELVEKILSAHTTCQGELNQLTRRTHDVSILVIAHSQGANVLELALRSPRLDASLKTSMRIITIGGASLIPSIPQQYKSVENLINHCDFIPLFAHSTLEFEDSQIESATLRGIVCVFASVKKMFQEQFLQVNSHTKPGLADRILHAMLAKWTNPEDAPQVVASKALGIGIAKAGEKHLQSPHPSTQDLTNCYTQLVISLLNHALYKVDVLQTPQPSANNGHFENSHSVQSYLNKVTELVLSYIRQHESSNA